MIGAAGPVWTGDDFSQYARRLLETVPLEVVTLGSLIIVANQLRQVKERDSSYLALAREDDGILAFEHKVLSYEQVFGEGVLQQDTENSESSKKSQVVIALVPRPTSERVRVAVEWLLVLLQTLLCVYALFSIDRLSGNYTLGIQAIFWMYALALVSYRVQFISSDKCPEISLWKHSTTLYLIAFLSLLVPFRSEILYSHSRLTLWYYMTQTLMATILLVLNCSAKYGDEPARVYVTDAPPNNEAVSSIFDLLSYSFASTYFWRGFRQHINSKNVPELREDDHALRNVQHFEQFRRKLSFQWTILKSFQGELAGAFAYAVLFALTIFGPAVFVNLILSYIDDPDSTPRNVAWLYVAGILVLGSVKSVANNQVVHIGRRLALRLRAVLIADIYAKALRRKVSAVPGPSGEKKDEKDDDTQANTGKIINLMSLDAYKVGDAGANLHYFVSGIMQISIAIILLYSLLGWSAFVGAFTMVIFLPANYWLSKKYSGFQKSLMKVTDQRINKTNELLQSIRIIKFFAWESKFAEGVAEFRDQELAILREQFIYWSFGGALFFAIPATVSAVTFTSYTLIQGQVLTSPVAFTSMALFQILRFPTDMLPYLLSGLLQAKVSLKRISDFLLEEDTDKYSQLSSHGQRGATSPYIGFENASFSWGTKSGSASAVNFKLRDLNIEFPVGKMSVVFGPTGSGKSSLLLALLGEMNLYSGSVFLPGAVSRETVRIGDDGFTDTIAYCSQQAWVLNDTIRNNITFASDFDEERYNLVIQASQLTRDLEIFDAGDETEVGEKGITLSGGQKQRVSLARAMYTRSKHLILDDCLSAVDSHTALEIYDRCLCGPLASGRTIILVSHNGALTISNADKVIILDNGRIKAQGSPSEVSSYINQDGGGSSSSGASSHIESTEDLSKLGGPTKEDALKNAKDTAERLAVGEAPESEAAPPQPEQKKASGKLVQDEKMAQGSVERKVYASYFKAMGNWWFWVLIALTYLVVQGFSVLQSWWVREWTLNGLSQREFQVVASADNGHPASYYIVIYYFIAMVSIVGSVWRQLTVFNGSVRASRLIFYKLFHSVIRAPARFFDTTPVGRIINRFSKDIQSIDMQFAGTTMNFLNSMVSTFTTILLITYITPSFLIAGIFIAAFYYVIGTLYVSASRELKRIESVSKSPIFQHFGETLAGITTIRAYGDQRRFVRTNLKLIDDSNGPFYYYWVANRWFNIRVDVMGYVVTASAAAFSLLALGSIDSGLAGLSLSYALTFSEVMLWFVRLYADMEMQANAMERIQEFIEIEPEAPAIVSDNRPPTNWPSNGEIEFKSLSLRYAPDLPLVIRDVSFKIEKANKIGIVGRTGAGKSTIITALFRLLEAESGSIEIDGLDIARIGLEDLRQALSIIPQDPTLFVGTIRTNLDPFDEYSDSQIFEALRRVHLISPSEQATSSPDENQNQFLNLSSPVSEGGNNLSQGQRQLICLARSLLKSPKILMLDEATASIDYDTDAKIQATIREEFGHTTLLTVAHRLRSIVDYDKILVLADGQVVEYDTPKRLLKNKDGMFYDMCAKSGELEQLVQLAC